MALDPHPDREPGYDARIWSPVTGVEWAKASEPDPLDGRTGLWVPLGREAGSLTWPELATRWPAAEVRIK